MNRVERAVDQLNPSLSVRLRLLKKKLRHDMTLVIIGELVGRGERAIDVGAYRGVNTIKLADRVGSPGHVWAIEPFPDNAAYLERVTRRRRNVTVCPWAASDHEGRQELVVPVHDGHRIGALATVGGVSVSAPTETVTIDLRTVDDLLERSPHRSGAVSFIRCDVVGHEAAVIAGAERTLRQYLPALLVEIEQRHQSGPVQETFDRLAACGYDGYFLRHQSLLPLDSFDLERDQLSFVSDDFVPYSMPVEYVHYFLFVRPETDLSRLLG